MPCIIVAVSMFVVHEASVRFRSRQFSFISELCYSLLVPCSNGMKLVFDTKSASSILAGTFLIQSKAIFNRFWFRSIVGLMQRAVNAEIVGSNPTETVFKFLVSI